MNIAMIVGSYNGLCGVCTHVQDLCKFLGRESLNTALLATETESLDSKELCKCRS